MRRSETPREARQALYPGNQVQKVMKARLPLVRQKQEVRGAQRLRFVKGLLHKILGIRRKDHSHLPVKSGGQVSVSVLPELLTDHRVRGLSTVKAAHKEAAVRGNASTQLRTF